MILAKVMLILLAFTVNIQSNYRDVEDYINKKTRGISNRWGDATMKGKTFFAYALLDNLRFSFTVDGKDTLGEFTIIEEPKDILYTFNAESTYQPDLLTYNGVDIDPPKTFFYLLEVLPDNTIEVLLEDTLHLKNTFKSTYIYKIKPIVQKSQTIEKTQSFRIALRFNSDGAIVTLIEKKDGIVISSTILESSPENTFITDYLSSEQSEWLVEVDSKNYDYDYDEFFQVDLLYQNPRESEIDNNPEYVVPYQYFYKTAGSLKGKDDFIVEFPADTFDALEAAIYKKIQGELALVKMLELTEENRIRVDMAKEVGNGLVNQELEEEYVLKIKFYTKTVPKADNSLLIAKYELEQIFEETPGILIRGNYYDNQAFVKIPANLLVGKNIVMVSIYQYYTQLFISDLQIGYDEVPKLSDNDSKFRIERFQINTLEVDQQKITKSKFVYVGLRGFQNGSFLEFEYLITDNIYKHLAPQENEVKFSLSKDQSLYIYHKIENYKYSISDTRIEASSEDYSAFTYSLNHQDYDKIEFTTIKRFFTFNVNDEFKQSKKKSNKIYDTIYHFLKLTANSDISGVVNITYSDVDENEEKKTIKYLK